MSDGLLDHPVLHRIASAGGRHSQNTERSLIVRMFKDLCILLKPTAIMVPAYRFSKAPNVILPLGLPVGVSPTFDDLWGDCDLSGIATLLKIPMDRWVL